MAFKLTEIALAVVVFVSVEELKCRCSVNSGLKLDCPIFKPGIFTRSGTLSHYPVSKNNLNM